MIAIVDYGLGNLASIKNMFKKTGERDVVITSDKDVIAESDKIVLPGVGAFDNGMIHLKEYDLIEVLNKKALEEKVPLLGICLGMQLMTKGSEEGKLPGLGWFDAETIKFKPKEGLKIPHMGWNFIKEKNPGNSFFNNSKKYRFYFVHSFHVKCNNPKDVLFTTEYGDDFHSAIRKGNLIGMQFHPEKSLNFGMEVFEKFAKL